jgi:hypothetical protein
VLVEVVEVEMTGLSVLISKRPTCMASPTSSEQSPCARSTPK